MIVRRAILLLMHLCLCLAMSAGTPLLAAERVSLNVGRYPTPEEARTLLLQLRSQGRDACLLRQENDQGEVTWMVQLGDYATMPEALDAMRKLRPKGVACEIQAIDEARLRKMRDCSPEAGATKLHNERASLHVGRFTREEEARQLINQLRSQGHTPCLLRRKDDQGAPVFSVQLGDYPTVEQALEAMRLYRPEGIACEVQVVDEATLLSQLDCSTTETINPYTPPDLEMEQADMAQTEGPGPMEALQVYDWDEEQDEINVFRLAERERDLVTARTLAQNDYTSAAMAWYASLMERFPQDEEIRDYYIDTLIKNEEYAKALTLLELWLQIDPDNVRANRLMAVMYTAMEEYESSFPYWERLHELRPYDMGPVVDHAFARRDYGDWMRAIELFSQALENDPDNTMVAEMLQELLKEHRPRYGVTVDAYLQQQNAETTLVAQRYGQHLSERAWLEVFYDVMRFQRPRVDEFTDPIDETLHDGRVRLTYELGRDWDLILGGGVYYDEKPDYSAEAGFNWQLHEGGELSGLFEYNRPWTDTIEAPANDGRRNTLSGGYQWLYDDRWQLTLDGLYTEYSVTNYDPYAWRTEVGGVLSRRLSWRPDLWLSYGYLRRWNVFADNSRPFVRDPTVPDGEPAVFIPLDDNIFRPVPLTYNEETHTISALVEDWFCKYIGYSLTAGVYQDVFKDSPAFFINPSLLWRFGQRADMRVGASYSSDSDVPGGGETLNLNMDMNVTF